MGEGPWGRAKETGTECRKIGRDERGETGTGRERE